MLQLSLVQENKSKWCTGNKINTWASSGFSRRPGGTATPFPLAPTPPFSTRAVGQLPGACLLGPRGRVLASCLDSGSAPGEWRGRGTEPRAPSALAFPPPLSPLLTHTHIPPDSGSGSVLGCSKKICKAHTVSPWAPGNGQFCEEGAAQRLKRHSFSWR